MKTRAELLQEFFRLESLEAILSIWEQLRIHGWDTDEEEILTSGHIISALNRYLEGELPGAAVTEWADLLEAREDVAYEESKDRDIRKALHDLGNPVLEGPLTPQSARELIEMLQSL